MRITIRVRPGSARPRVGGEHAGALLVRVSAPAGDGQATAAALKAVAKAFGVRPNTVTLVAGAASRTKIIDVPNTDPAVLTRLLGTVRSRWTPDAWMEHAAAGAPGRDIGLQGRQRYDSILAHARWAALGLRSAAR